VAVALGNWGGEEAVPLLVESLADAELRGHAAWALGRVGSGHTVAALKKALSTETDHRVIVEIREALAAASSPPAAERGVPAS
jgi:epoxyqueuosine reductase